MATTPTPVVSVALTLFPTNIYSQVIKYDPHDTRAAPHAVHEQILGVKRCLFHRLTASGGQQKMSDQQRQASKATWYVVDYYISERLRGTEINKVIIEAMINDNNAATRFGDSRSTFTERIVPEDGWQTRQGFTRAELANFKSPIGMDVFDSILLESLSQLFSGFENKNIQSIINSSMLSATSSLELLDMLWAAMDPYNVANATLPAAFFKLNLKHAGDFENYWNTKFFLYQAMNQQQRETVQNPNIMLPNGQQDQSVLITHFLQPIVERLERSSSNMSYLFIRAKEILEHVKTQNHVYQMSLSDIKTSLANCAVIDSNNYERMRKKRSFDQSNQVSRPKANMAKNKSRGGTSTNNASKKPRVLKCVDCELHGRPSEGHGSWECPHVPDSVKEYQKRNFELRKKKASDKME